ncbi:SPOR domain-containing protein [Manganibacter manganicus]|uniref:SPOR domain-containing protein n=1 Tax=Manganibacter manganicus TaxID=1873176 RepID=A0A1V8RRZ9_9HYPH|nr:SPOR domain-containing protein [Pseudaminobacter manganicus]OQM75769.1 hypothetical protein BFN67_02295 [Pseudaminobacter manganicus]
MADRTPLRAATPNDIGDDDPFAELTRIMGFDPREPVKSQETSLKPNEPATGEDFEIDLEKELMGEFGDADEMQDAHFMPADAVAPIDHAVSEEHQAEVPDFDFGEEIATSLEQATEPHSHDQPQVPHVMLREPDVASEDVDFDEVVARSFGDDFGVDSAQADDLSDALEAVPAVASESYEQDGPETEFAIETQAEPLTQADESRGDFLDGFDRSAEEGDPDFNADAEWADLEAAIDSNASHAPALEPDPFDGDFELDLHSELEASTRPAEDHDDHKAPGVGDTIISPTAVEMEPPHDDTTLEDELNALLNRMSAKPAVSPVAAEVLQVPPTETEADDSHRLIGDQQKHDLAPLPQHHQSDVDFGGEADIEFDDDAFLAALNEDEPASETYSDISPKQPRVDDSVAALPATASSGTPLEVSGDWGSETPLGQQHFAPEVAPAYGPVPRSEMPEVETVEVPERVIALADDLDIPDFTFEDKAGEAPVFDDIDADFAGLLNEMNDTEPTAVTSRAVSYDDDAYEAGFKHDHVEAPAYGEQRPSVLPDGTMAAATAAYGASAVAGFAASRSTDEPSFSSGATGMDNLDYDPSFDEVISAPDAATADATRQPSNRGLMLAAVVGAVAVIGGVGAFALSFGGSDGSGAPVLIKADNQPIKVKPENPGGTVIPNQDNKVYDVVANGAKPAAPEQKKLVADAQEPVDVNARPPLTDSEQPAAEDVGAGQKSEARLLPSEPVADETESKAVAAVAPRKVKTLIVKPDGTLVPREEAEPAVSVAAGEPADPAPQHVVNASSEDQTGAVPQTAKADTQGSQMPETAPVAPERPADQPVDIVGEVKPETVASIAPENTASGGWAMQIASQPSVESAQKTYQNLSRRYESILGGHDAKIVKAEIAGKGTFYRVRIAANSRDDAINLCTSYKAAGGNCFVSK